ncbi:uncharacterized protein LOC105166398 [Sesamum indicum]|uniref:Uncharacterized protein LOC105166398 n=1 Tax=Sesamum indicum TaxID=4182 RepID=A0A6I9TFP6_SESIN|nr:uncharacterized protein LOC105166398 [Sesamum indicum]
MATGAAGGAMFEGCISGADMGIQRRPYHKNCKCALHKARGRCPHSPRNNNVSYPIRRSWSEGCLALMSPTSTTGSTSPCPSSPTVAAAPELTRAQTQLVLWKEEDEEGEEGPYFNKV